MYITCLLIQKKNLFYIYFLSFCKVLYEFVNKTIESERMQKFQVTYLGSFGAILIRKAKQSNKNQEK